MATCGRTCGAIPLLDKSIKSGDAIELGETFGWISSLGDHYVSVATRDGKGFLIPDEDPITQRVVNWSLTNKLVRMEIIFGVSYDSDPHEVPPYYPQGGGPAGVAGEGDAAGLPSDRCLRSAPLPPTPPTKRVSRPLYCSCR